MPYQANDMVYLDYGWTPENRSDKNGNDDLPMSCGLNTHNGEEMLQFINNCAERLHWTDHLPSYQSLEVDLRTAVPAEVKSQQGLFEWIQRRYAIL